MPDFGDLVGPVSGSWLMGLHAGHYRIIGEAGASDGLFPVLPLSTSTFTAILDEPLPAATDAKTGVSSALATVCDWDSSVSESPESLVQVLTWNHSEWTSYGTNTFGVVILASKHLLFLGDCGPMGAR